MSSKPSTTDNDPSDAVDELKALIREAEEALSSTGDKAADQIEDLRERMRGVLAEGKTTVKQLTEKLRRQAGRADDVIRENPYQSIGIAAGVGLIAGYLLSRGRNGDR